MSLSMIGLDHHLAPLALREKVFCDRARATDLARQIIAQKAAQGVVVLSTCARTEIYLDDANEEAVREILSAGDEEISAYAYTLMGREAVVHLFSVVAGAHSPVFGDTDVIRQVRGSYAAALANGTATFLLSRLFERALFAGRAIRAEAGTSRKDVTVASLAVERAWEWHADLCRGNIFVIGTGVVGLALVAEWRQRGMTCTLVAGRNFKKAGMLASEHGCRAVDFEGFFQELNSTDLIFSATASPHLILTQTKFNSLVASGKKIAIFDLAVPRDVDPGIGSQSGVALYTVDDLRSRAGVDIQGRIRVMAAQKADAFLGRQGLLL